MALVGLQRVWSSSSYADGDGYAWYVYFDYGSAYYMDKAPRTGSAASVAAVTDAHDASAKFGVVFIIPVVPAAPRAPGVVAAGDGRDDGRRASWTAPSRRPAARAVRAGRVLYGGEGEVGGEVGAEPSLASWRWGRCPGRGGDALRDGEVFDVAGAKPSLAS